MIPAPGTLLAERYRLERPLASGGMGSVWVARHLALDAEVAVKLMSDAIGSDPSARARFEREAKVVARLKSAHVVRAIDYGVDRGVPFLVMDLLYGESLEERLRRVGSLPAGAVAHIVDDIARCLEETHGLGLVHRDLKPANVFLALADGVEVVKVLDFGIAKETDRRLVQDDETQTGTLLGSPQHMSPEQARGGEVDARSDLWSLGVVAYRALTGKRPFAGANMADIVAKICLDPVPRPSDDRPDLGEHYDSFFRRAFARRPERRFQTARELADAFRVLVATAAPPATPVRLAETAPSVVARAESTEEADLPQVGPIAYEETTTGLSNGAPLVSPRRTRPWAAVAAVLTLLGGAATLLLHRADAPPVSASAPSSFETLTAVDTSSTSAERRSFAEPSAREAPTPPASVTAAPPASVTAAPSLGTPASPATSRPVVRTMRSGSAPAAPAPTHDPFF